MGPHVDRALERWRDFFSCSSSAVSTSLESQRVNLYSDPPKPGRLVLSGQNKETSKVLMLDFPQAQRAEINSASPRLNEQSRLQGSSSVCPSTRSQGPQVGQQLAQIFISQAEKFLQQLQTFKDLLMTKTLKPVEQMKVVAQLAEELDSLEKSYLLTKDQHKLLQQQGVDFGHFDPELELGRLIRQCGLCLEELKEQVEQVQLEEPTVEVYLSPSLHHTSSSVASEGKETQTPPQSPPLPPLVNERESAGVEGNTSSQENEEETLNSPYLNSLDSKHKCLEQDFDRQVDHNQSLKELHQGQRDGAPHSAALRTVQEERERQANPEVQILPQRKADLLDSPSVIFSEQQPRQSSPPLGRDFSQSTSPPVPCPRSRRSVEMLRSHSSSLSSLGEITTSQRRNSKLQTQIKRGLSQDRIISPEMDSGFVGSESSRLTPAAATSPLHQRGPKSRVSAPQEEISGKLPTGPAAAPCPASSLLHSQAVVQQDRCSQLSPNLSSRSRQGQRRRRFSGSLQHRICELDQSRAERGNREFWVASDSSVYEDRFIDGSLSLLSSSSSSPAACDRRGISPGAPTSSPVADPSTTVQTLRAELSRLKESADSCLRNQTSKSSPKSPSAQRNYSHIYTAIPHDRSDEPGSGSCRGRRDSPTVDDVSESMTRRATKKRPTLAHRRKSQLVYSESSSPEPPHLVSRSTQTSAAASDGHTSRTQSRQRSRVSETADEPDSRGRTAPPCLHAPRNKRSTSSGGRGLEEGSRRRTHFLWVDCQLDVNSSLDRAIRAARHMKSTSAHMVYELDEGLHNLKQSCSF